VAGTARVVRGCRGRVAPPQSGVCPAATAGTRGSGYDGAGNTAVCLIAADGGGQPVRLCGPPGSPGSPGKACAGTGGGWLPPDHARAVAIAPEALPHRCHFDQGGPRECRQPARVDLHSVSREGSPHLWCRTVQGRLGLLAQRQRKPQGADRANAPPAWSAPL
jgi:hypothetical protein